MRRELALVCVLMVLVAVADPALIILELPLGGNLGYGALAPPHDAPEPEFDDDAGRAYRPNNTCSECVPSGQCAPTYCNAVGQAA